MGLVRAVKLWFAARRLSRAAAERLELAALFRLASRSRVLRPKQIETEFVGFLTRAWALAPARIVEIGTGRGGTAFLLAAAAARGGIVVTLDLEHDPAFVRVLPRLAPPETRIVAVSGDSRHPAVRQAVREALGGPVDVLFLDGDHSYDGVRRDHETYGPLVRLGGLIAFHDIVADHAQRFGRATSHDTGGVPRYWSEVRGRIGSYPNCPAVEIVADSRQDGFGIGVLTVPK